jgi:hypothetical protein
MIATNHGRAERKPHLAERRLLFPRAIEVLFVSFPSTYQPAKAGIGIKNVHVVVMWGEVKWERPARHPSSSATRNAILYGYLRLFVVQEKRLAMSFFSFGRRISLDNN